MYGSTAIHQYREEVGQVLVYFHTSVSRGSRAGYSLDFADNFDEIIVKNDEIRLAFDSLKASNREHRKLLLITEYQIPFP